MRSLFIVLAACSAFAISACNTIEGAGEDVSSAGSAVADTARDAAN
jgi:predicted small secreted protein